MRGGPTGPERETVDVVYRNRWLTALGALPLAVVPFALIGIGVPGAVGAMIAFYATMLSAAVSYLLWKRNPLPTMRSEPFGRDADALRIGARRIPRRHLRAGYVVPGRPASVVLARRWLPDIEIEAESTDEGEAILDRLGLGVTAMTARFRVASPLTALVLRWQFLAAVGIVALGVLSALLLAPLAPQIFPLPFVVLAALMALPQRVEVGADGVHRRWLGRHRFVPHDRIVATHQRRRGIVNRQWSIVTIDCADGSTVELATDGQYGGHERAAGLRARIERARDAVVAPDSPVALARPEGQAVSDWVVTLRSILEVGAHRRGAVTAEQLWQIVASTAATAVDRAAAAVALDAELAPSERKRIADLSEATAEPRLRVVLDRVASNADSEALAEALAAVEEDQARAQRR